MDTTAEVTARIDLEQTDVNDQLRRADAKAASLLPMFSGFLAGVVALSTRPMPTAAVVLLWLSAVPIALAVLALLNVVRPRFSDRDSFGFPRLVTFTGRPSELLDTLTEDASPTVQAVALSGCAAIVRTKYRRVRLAVDLLTIGLVLLAMSLAVAAVA